MNKIEKIPDTLQGGLPLLVELYSEFPFVVWLFNCRCIFIKPVSYLQAAFTCFLPKAHDCTDGTVFLQLYISQERKCAVCLLTFY